MPKNQFSITGTFPKQDITAGNTVHFTSGNVEIDFTVKTCKWNEEGTHFEATGHTNPEGKRGPAGTIEFDFTKRSGIIEYR